MLAGSCLASLLSNIHAYPALAAAVPPATGHWPVHDLLKPNLRRSWDARLPYKGVVNSRILHVLEQPSSWKTSNSAVVTKRMGQGVEFSAPMIDTGILGGRQSSAGGPRRAGTTSYVRDGGGAVYWRYHLAKPESWSEYTRLRIRIRPVETGLASYRLVVALVSKEAGGGVNDPLPFHFLPGLQAGEWNDLIWEFNELPRDQVTQLAILMPQVGPNGAVARYELEEIRLETSAPEKISGWAIASDSIACHHLGYETGGRKVAFGALGEKNFEIVDTRTDRAIARFPTRKESGQKADYAVLDFSEFERPGRYRLRAGKIVSPDFTIGRHVQATLVDALTNFFYADRCGHAIDGIHDVCHTELLAEYQGQRKPANGGWHDAGNLCQGAYRTTLGVASLLSAYETVGAALPSTKRARLLEEACWGLDWLLATRFGRGVRVINAGFTVMQDGREGSGDEIIVAASSATFENMLFVTTALKAATILQNVDQLRSKAAQAAALEDYKAAITEFPDDVSSLPEGANLPAPHELLGYAVQAALAVYSAIGDITAKQQAVAFARQLIDLQEQRCTVAGRLFGYYNRDPAGRRRAIDIHTSFADAPARGLAALCRAMPDHPDRARWHAAVAFESEGFLQRGAAHTAPFYHVPTAVWTRADIEGYVGRASQRIPYASAFGAPDITPPDTRDGLQRTIESELNAATKLNDDTWLRTFPIAEDQVFHGASTIQLTRALSLDAASRLRARPELSSLAQAQVDWQLGVNPFCASFVYGVGDRYASLMQLWADDFVGAVPVGVGAIEDAPFWPHTCHMTSREMWVVPAARLLELVGVLHEPSVPAAWKLTAVGLGAAFDIVANGPSTSRPHIRLIGHNLTIETSDGAVPNSRVWKAKVIDNERAWAALLLAGDGTTLADIVGPQ